MRRHRALLPWQGRVLPSREVTPLPTWGSVEVPQPSPLLGSPGLGPPPKRTALPVSLLWAVWVPTTATPRAQSPPHATMPSPVALARTGVEIPTVAVPLLRFAIAACRRTQRKKRIIFFWKRFLPPSGRSAGLAPPPQKASISICSSELVLSVGTLHLLLGPLSKFSLNVGALDTAAGRAWSLYV
jgi:hypothetical protein